ncbi:MAG: M81 family metallopeptidase [Alphaproteobacteria bacterium]|nr:M81 family metallopeptidase [Alphaproteobacteria bacterium]
MARIGVGGFMHETNSFSPVATGYDDFARAGDREPLLRGPALLTAFQSANVSLGGAVEALGQAGHGCVPLTWTSAAPGGKVTRAAYERIAGMLLEDLKAAGRLDGLYLCLHGAMVAEHIDDGEGELLARIRSLVGDALPIVASLDYHANVSPAMARLATALVGYRTYPHVDPRETGRRAGRLLLDILAQGRAPYQAFRQIDFLAPLTWQCTLSEPCRGLIAKLESLEGGDVASLTFAAGFPAADFADCGPSVMGYGWDQAAVARAVDRLAEAVNRAEPAFGGKLYAPDEAAREAKRIAATAARPVVLADTQDNPGAGGTGDTVGLLAALIRNRVEGAVVAAIADAETARQAHAAGLGAVIPVTLGAKSGVPGHAPLAAEARVEALADGNFVGTGPMAHGRPQRLGPCALLSIEGVRAIVTGRKVQALDQSLIRHLGLEPARQKVLALKSSVHFRADFEPIAEAVLVVEAPGLMLADPAKLPFRNLRAGIRTRPGDPGSAFRPV